MLLKIYNIVNVKRVNIFFSFFKVLSLKKKSFTYYDILLSDCLIFTAIFMCAKENNFLFNYRTNIR